MTSSHFLVHLNKSILFFKHAQIHTCRKITGESVLAYFFHIWGYLWTNFPFLSPHVGTKMIFIDGNQPVNIVKEFSEASVIRPPTLRF